MANINMSNRFDFCSNGRVVYKGTQFTEYEEIEEVEEEEDEKDFDGSSLIGKVIGAITAAGCVAGAFGLIAAWGVGTVISGGALGGAAPLVWEAAAFCLAAAPIALKAGEEINKQYQEDMEEQKDSGWGAYVKAGLINPVKVGAQDVVIGAVIGSALAGGVRIGSKLFGKIFKPKVKGIVNEGSVKAGTEKIVWPPNNGGILGTEKNVVLGRGYQFDRYGLNTGSYVAPIGTPYEMRSLAPGTELKPCRIFEVVKPVRGEGSVIAPWFGQPGGGIQIKLNNTIQELIDSGRIVEVKK